MAIRTSPSPSLRETLRNGNIFGGGTHANLNEAMNSTWNNLRTGSFGTPAPAAAQPQEEAAPTAPVAPPLATPPMNPALLPGNPFSTPGTTPASVAAAGGLLGAQQQGDMSSFQDMLRLGGVNLNPVGQSPGDFHENMKRGIAMFKNSPAFKDPADAQAGGAAKAGSPGSFTGLPFGTPVSTYAPDDLRQRALAAGGAPVTGIGGAQVTGIAGPSQLGADGRQLPIYQQQGSRFTLKQNPNTVPGAPGYVPAPTAPKAPASAAAPAAPGQDSFTKNAAAYQASTTGGVYEAPNGDRFMRDPAGRLQSAGANPDLAAAAAGKKTGAETEARAQTEDAVKFNGSIRDGAEESRMRSDSIGQILELYAKGATTGAGQQYFTAVNSALNRLGVDDSKISSQQELEKQMNALGLQYRRALMKGTGQVSDYETKQAEKAFPNANLTKEANMHMFEVMQRLDQRNETLETERIRLQKMGLPSVQIRKEIEQLRDTMPLGIDKTALVPGAPVKVGKYDVVVH